jgi:hypothetical protein
MKSPVILNRNKVSMQDSLCNLTPPEDIQNNLENLSHNEINMQHSNTIKAKKTNPPIGPGFTFEASNSVDDGNGSGEVPAIEVINLNIY